MYTYIFAPKNAQNIAVFEYALTAFPELVEQQRTKETQLKVPEDVIEYWAEPNPTNGADITKNGPYFLMIKAITADIPPELIAQIDSPEMYTEPADVTDKFW